MQEGIAMKRLLWALPLLVAVMSANALADSVNIFLAPNDGSGDNFAFLSQASGVSVNIQGGIPFGAFSTQGFAPGSGFGLSTDVFFSSGTIQLGNNVYDILFSGPGTLFVSSFTFPTNGQGFSILASASFSASGFIFIDGQQTPVSVGGSGLGTMTFSFDPSTGLYYGNLTKFSSTTVPEPGTLGLMGTGLIGMLGFVRSKLRGRHFGRTDA
jgi:hypothetical protein